MIVKLGWFDFLIVSIITMSKPDGLEKALLEGLTVFIILENTIMWKYLPEPGLCCAPFLH